MLQEVICSALSESEHSPDGEASRRFAQRRGVNSSIARPTWRPNRTNMTAENGDQCHYETLDDVKLDERLRMRTLARYFLPAQITADTLRAINGQPVAPSLSQDSHLTGLAQLGPLKLQCDRAFISLLSTSAQFIIAEATRSISLRQTHRHRGDQDALFLGVQALHMSYGVCPNTVKIFTDATGTLNIDTPDVVANPTRYIIRDFRSLDLFKDRPYVVGFPHMRSYAEVPLKSANGRVIGSYCVVDTSVRQDFFDDDAVFTLTEIAESIVDYLDSVNARHVHARGERLMEGLSIFAENRLAPMTETNARKERRAWSRSHLKLSEAESAHQVPSDLWPSSSASQSARRLSNQSSVNCSGMRFEPLLTTPSEESSSFGFSSGSSSEAKTPLTTPSETPSLPDTLKESDQSLPLARDQHQPIEHDTQRPLQLADTKSVFGRAAAIIRDALDVDGLAFFTEAEHRVNNSQNKRSSSHCQILAESLASDHRTGDLKALELSSLRYLARYFPQGQIFTVDRYGAFPSDSDTQHVDEHNGDPNRSRLSLVPAELQQVLPTARSIIFQPLQSLSSNEFFAGLIGWTADPVQHLSKDGLISLRAFGNAVMTEVARSEANFISRAKSDFISSVSHELRSPLHGVLTSVELLEDSPIGELEKEIVRMIEKCGSTLLDTLNHLLDYSQINRFNGLESRVEGPSLATRNAKMTNFHGKTSVVALDHLVTDVVESIHSGAQSQRFVTASHSLPLSEMKNVGVHVNIRHGSDWQMPLHVGAWKRIVMNIFANSMKFTHHGYIEVLLSLVQRADDDGINREYARLVVHDTGIGMSKQYLEHQLFTSFIQEDSQQPGTGLGLSLVKQIVDDLEGTINVESVQGLGTRTDLLIPISRSAGEANPKNNKIKDTLDSTAVLRGQTVCLVMPPRPDATKSERGISGDQTASLTRLLSDIVQDWLGMHFIIAEDLAEVQADFFVLHDDASNPRLEQWPVSADKRILYIGSDDSYFRKLGGATPVSYPISPRSLSQNLLRSLKNGLVKQTDCVTPRSLDDPKTVGPPGSSYPTSSSALEHDEEPKQEYIKPYTKPQQTAEPSTPKSASHNVRPEHALIVDDNAINLKILQSFLKKLGCTVAIATNGLEAVEVYKATKRAFDVVFMDISMPIMDGFEASRKIREYEKEYPEQIKSPTHIIALTGLGSEESQQEAFASGIDQFHTKPVKLDHIRKLLGSITTATSDSGENAPRQS